MGAFVPCSLAYHSTCVYVNHVRKYHMCSLVDDVPSIHASHVIAWYLCPQVGFARGVAPNQWFGVTDNWLCVCLKYPNALS